MASFVPAQIASFEAAASLEWTVEVGPATASRSLAQAHDGVASMLIDAITGTYAQVNSDPFPLDATVTSATGWIFADAPARTCDVLWGLLFFDPGMIFAGLISGSGPVPDGGWSPLTASGPAPAGSAFGVLAVQVRNSDNAWSPGEGIYVDDFATSSSAPAAAGWYVGAPMG